MNGTGNPASFTFHRGTMPAQIPEFQNGDGWFAALQCGDANLRIGQHKNASDENDAYVIRNRFLLPMQLMMKRIFQIKCE